MRTAFRLATAGIRVSALALAAVPTTASAQAFNKPGGPNYPTPSSSDEPPCEYGMGYLGRVNATQIRGIDDNWRVWVRPVCEDSPHAPVRNMGNATQLIGAIGRNETLEAALQDARFLADDVVGVKITKGNSVMLWVHPSLYR